MEACFVGLPQIISSRWWHSNTNKYHKQLLRNNIVSRHKYCWFLLTNPSQRERNLSTPSAQLLGGRSTLSSQSEGTSSQVNDVDNDWFCSFRWSWQWLKGYFSVQSTTTSWSQPPLAVWQRGPGSEGGDTSQDQGPLCLQELEEGVCHHGEAEPPHHCLLARGRLCRQVLLMSGLRLFPWRQSRRQDWNELFELYEEISRWLFNFDHHFFDNDCKDDRDDEGSFWAEMYKRGKTMFAQEGVCAPWPLPRSSLP